MRGLVNTVTGVTALTSLYSNSRPDAVLLVAPCNVLFVCRFM